MDPRHQPRPELRLATASRGQGESRRKGNSTIRKAHVESTMEATGRSYGSPMKVAEKPTKSPAARLVRADGRPADMVAFDEAVVAFFFDAADILGVPKSLAAIYGVCFASPEPL